MNCRPWSSALVDSSSGNPRHLGADSFDCGPERNGIVVLYLPPPCTGCTALRVKSGSVTVQFDVS